MVTVITGPPCSGKSTYAREHAKPGDVIVDFDALAHALGAPLDHMSEGAPRAAANSVFAAAVRFCCEELRGADAWIVHSRPSTGWRGYYARRGARLVTANADLGTCLQRARDGGRPEGTEAAIRAFFGAVPALPAGR